MSQKTIVTLTDDLDGSPADRTLTFAIDGETFEIDLNKRNATAFERTFQPYVNAARHAPAHQRSRKAQAVNTAGRGRKDLTAVREWAKSHNITVSDRGRVAQSVLDAYDAAH